MLLGPLVLLDVRDFDVQHLRHLFCVYRREDVCQWQRNVETVCVILRFFAANELGVINRLLQGSQPFGILSLQEGT